MSITLQKLQILRPKKSQVLGPEGNFSKLWYGWFKSLFDTFNANIATLQARLNPGITVTITTAKLTVGGANGSMTFTNGILTAQTQAT